MEGPLKRAALLISRGWPRRAWRRARNASRRPRRFRALALGCESHRGLLTSGLSDAAPLSEAELGVGRPVKRAGEIGPEAAQGIPTRDKGRQDRRLCAGISPLFCFDFGAASAFPPLPAFRSRTTPRRKVCASAGNQVDWEEGQVPRSGRVQCLGFAVRIPISRACHRGFTGTAARKGHQNGFPQATVAPHEPPPTHL